MFKSHTKQMIGKLCKFGLDGFFVNGHYKVLSVVGKTHGTNAFLASILTTISLFCFFSIGILLLVQSLEYFKAIQHPFLSLSGIQEGSKSPYSPFQTFCKHFFFILYTTELNSLQVYLNFFLSDKFLAKSLFF